MGDTMKTKQHRPSRLPLLDEEPTQAILRRLPRLTSDDAWAGAPEGICTGKIYREARRHARLDEMDGDYDGA